MNKTQAIQRALVSVSDKTNLIELANNLHALNIEIISTGGTANALKAADIPVTLVSEVTGFPEIMSGRVKTLHPKIHGGILGDREQHQTQADQHGIAWLDLVICNLYPFEETIASDPDNRQAAIEKIDIGGPCMIRAAAKNFNWVTVITDPEDYAELITALQSGGVSDSQRLHYSAKAFQHTSFYDGLIAEYLAPPSPLPDLWQKTHRLHTRLRYGENPHQEAAVYQQVPAQASGLLTSIQHQGKALSYNNLADGDAALAAVSEFSKPTCVVVKHATPCGIASANEITQAFHLAFEADKQSAFGGIVALNRPCTQAIADSLTEVFLEVIIAPNYEPEALSMFSKKPNLRVLQLTETLQPFQGTQVKSIQGGLLVQTMDSQQCVAESLSLVTETGLSDQQLDDLLFAWQAVKHIKSNAIVIAKAKTTLGIGGGQVSRIDAVKLALEKAGNPLAGAVLASDAFFPFRDSIDKLAGTGIQAIVQPGGSIKDEEVIAACNEHGIAMCFTGTRAFKH